MAALCFGHSTRNVSRRILGSIAHANRATHGNQEILLVQCVDVEAWLVSIVLVGASLRGIYPRLLLAALASTSNARGLEAEIVLVGPRINEIKYGHIARFSVGFVLQ